MVLKLFLLGFGLTTLAERQQEKCNSTSLRLGESAEVLKDLTSDFITKLAH